MPCAIQMERERTRDSWGSKRHIGSVLENSCGMLSLRHRKRGKIDKMVDWCDDFLEEFDGAVVSEFNKARTNFHTTAQRVCVER